jgi:hypothetical protein
MRTMASAGLDEWNPQFQTMQAELEKELAKLARQEKLHLKEIAVETVYHIDTTQAFPQTPPSWVMADAYLALLVGDGSVTVA